MYVKRKSFANCNKNINKKYYQTGDMMSQIYNYSSGQTKINFNLTRDYEYVSMYFYSYFVQKRGCNLMDIFFRCDRSIRSRDVDHHYLNFVLSLLEHKNVFTHINNVGLVAHSYFNNFNYHLERKKETFLAILYRRLIQKMVKKLGVFEFWNIFFLYVLFSCKNFPF